VVEFICTVLQVAPSSYYAAKTRPPSARARRDAELTPQLIKPATLVTAADELRAELEPLTDHKLITACAALEPGGELDDPTRRSLARRWLELHEEIKTHSRHLKVQTKAAAPRLVEAVGIGLDIAAEMLVTAGDNSDRVRSESAFAKLCGASPIPAGSGKTSGRHRLNRGGNRQANAALYRAIVVRMRWHQPTIDYVARRAAEGLSKREIIRCLKRYLAREIYRLLPPPSAAAEPHLDPLPRAA
jgi:transposase